MKNSEILQALKAGGALREEALATLFVDDAIRENIRNRLKKYKKRIDQYIPPSDRVFGGRRVDNAADFFMLEAVFKLDKKLRDVRKDKQFRGETYPEMAGFIVQTAVFLCIGELRKRSKEEASESIPDDMAEYFETGLLNAEKYTVLHGLLDQLGKGCKEILLMFYGGFKYEEIAKNMGLKSADGAKTQKHRCYQSLLTHLERKPSITEFLK
jgi:RNA polymerase sigma factor (sigma-70 family)